jgi:hypothetical protein
MAMHTHLHAHEHTNSCSLRSPTETGPDQEGSHRREGMCRAGEVMAQDHPTGMLPTRVGFHCTPHTQLLSALKQASGKETVLTQKCMLEKLVKSKPVCDQNVL